MFTISGSILDTSTDASSDAAAFQRTDADLITTLVTIGFTAGRLAVGNPVEFSWDPANPADEQETEQATASIRKAVGPDGQYVRVTKAPAWEMGSLITGAAGSSAKSFASRHAKPSSQAAQQLQEIAARDANVGYQGYGAYTGFVDVPFTNKGSVKSTMRSNVPRDSFGDRWRPVAYSYAQDTGLTEANAPWGLLADGRKIDGMAAQDPVPGGVVGYTHGMVQSVYDAVATGPWCTPFEIAVGTKTTKLASCMACTTLMYAGGYPPSSVHLGRADSWAPFYPASPGADGYSMVLDEGIRSTNARWALECWQHLGLGMDLARAGSFLAPAHVARLDLLAGVMEERSSDLYAAANLFLDALTVHDSFVNRIARAIPLAS